MVRVVINPIFTRFVLYPTTKNTLLIKTLIMEHWIEAHFYEYQNTKKIIRVKIFFGITHQI